MRIDEEYRKPPEIVWDEDAYRGDAYAVFSYAAAVVDLEIDKRTCEVTVRKVTTAQDVGKAINPLLVEGQIIGGTVQGLGYALLEHVVYRDGVMHNAQLTNYVIPTSLDTPPMDVTLVEYPVLARAVGRERRRRAADGRAGAGRRGGRLSCHWPVDARTSNIAGEDSCRTPRAPST